MKKENTSPEQELLDRMYKNVSMGASSLIDLMPKVTSSDLRNELTSQLNRYEEFSNQISNRLYEMGSKPKEENPISRLSAKIGVSMNTMVDATSSHIAQMIIEGATMGMTDMTRALREYENTACSEDTLRAARSIAAFEEDTVNRMQAYL